MSFSCLQFDENIKLIIRRYDQANSEPEKSLLNEGRSLKPETPEPDGDSNQERAKDRGEHSDNVDGQMVLLDKYPDIKPLKLFILLWPFSSTGRDDQLLPGYTCKQQQWGDGGRATREGRVQQKAGQ